MMNRFISGMPPAHPYYSPGILSSVVQPLPSPTPSSQAQQLPSLHHSHPHPNPVPMQSANSHRMAQMFLVKQTSLLEEKFSKNGIQKNLHVVVKNTPFTFTLSLSGATEQVNFHRFILEAALLYDFDEPKEVDFVRLKPLEYRSQANDLGDACTVEMRIKVLSSQLEDMYFRIRFTAYDSVTRSTTPGLVVYSEPIKVISKPDQIVKKKEPKSSGPVSKKSLSDLMAETLSRIEENQREQKEMLSILNSRPRGSSLASSQEIPKKKQKTSSDDKDKEKEGEEAKEEKTDPLEKEFFTMIRYFEELTNEEKKNKVHALKEDLGSEKQEFLQELIDLLLADNRLNQRDKASQTSLQVSSLPPTLNSNACLANDCRSVKERAEIEQFYSDFIGSSWQP